MYQLIQFRTPNIRFGMDTISQIGQEAKKLGAGRVLLVTGPRVKAAGILEKAVSFLKGESISVEVAVEDRDTPEPATTVVEEGAEIAKHALCLERESNVKKAVASSNLLPDVAIIDPMLTVSCPPPVTASAGIDAFLHAAEPFLSKMANPITDAMSLEAISITSRWLGPAFADGQDLDARYYMSLGSLMSGIVLNNSWTSLVHAMAYTVGGEYHTPHGVTLSALVVACFDYIRVSKQEKMVRLGRAMGEPVDGLPPREASVRALDAIRHLIRSVGLPASLKES